MARSLVTMLAIVMVVVLALLARDWIVGAQSGIAGFVPPVLDDRSVFEIAAMFVLALFGFVLVYWASGAFLGAEHDHGWRGSGVGDGLAIL